MTEHLNHRESTDFSTGERRFMAEFPPEFWTSAGAVAVAGLSAVSSRFSHKASQRAEIAVNGISERNQAVSETRVQKEANQETVNDARDDVLREIVFALQREGIGNGSLNEAVESFDTVRREAKKQNDVCNLRMQSIDERR
jgi:hypothetical protein